MALPGLSIFKLLLQLLLLFFFLKNFGEPAVKRYLMRQTMVVRCKRPTGGIEAPEITIVGHNKTGGTWREPGHLRGRVDVLNSIEAFCEGEENITGCIIQKTYERTEFVKNALLGSDKRESLMSPTLWSEDFTNTRSGRSYTLKVGNRIGPRFSKDYIMLYLDVNLKYDIFIHEEKFFLLNENMAFPSQFIGVDPSVMKRYYKLTLTQHKRLDLPDSRCQQAEDYNFQACVRESLSNQVQAQYHQH